MKTHASEWVGLQNSRRFLFCSQGADVAALESRISALEATVSDLSETVAAMRRELEESRTEMLNLTTTNKRLQSELDQKAGLIADLSQRIDEVARKTGNGGPVGKGAQQSSQVASLVERINRLEEALKAARRENEILKGA